MQTVIKMKYALHL